MVSDIYIFNPYLGMKKDPLTHIFVSGLKTPTSRRLVSQSQGLAFHLSKGAHLGPGPGNDPLEPRSTTVEGDRAPRWAYPRARGMSPQRAL